MFPYELMVIVSLLFAMSKEPFDSRGYLYTRVIFLHVYSYSQNHDQDTELSHPHKGLPPASFLQYPHSARAWCTVTPS